MSIDPGALPSAPTASLPLTGLTAAEVAHRRENGQANDLPPRSGRTVAQIVKDNVFTRINFMLGTLAAMVAVTGSWKNGLFGGLIIANSIIGIIQELRAKKTLDELAVVGEAKPRVRREGITAQIDRREVVLDDVIELFPGDQVSVDGVIVESEYLEIDESLLTGEADAVPKPHDAEVLSGSFVSSGSGAYRATVVGPEAYAAKLAAEASRFTLVNSELRNGIDAILRFITWLLVPVGLLIIYVQLFTIKAGFREAILGLVAALVPMVPEGLVLMTSIAFAVGVIRLGKRQCLVQELPAIEGLARVNVVCADKTGTLTEGSMAAREIIPLPEGDEEPGDTFNIAYESARQLGALDPHPNDTMAAVIDYVSEPETPWQATDEVPFNSARKWSGASFANQGSVLIGAPDVLAVPGSLAANMAEEYGSRGLRILLIAVSEQPISELAEIPGPLPITPVGLVVLVQKVRDDAGDTIQYFHREGVRVKVISGDNATSVAAVTRNLGIGGPDTEIAALDGRDLPEDIAELAQVVEKTDVFGRVKPHQKRAMVSALQSKGHTVAMTGDGVNDVLALKDADIGVAMGAGSEASRSAAQIVLLDNSFATLPHVVAEGRRVIGNIERVAALFLTKTVYSALLALLIGLSSLPFPFIPLHVTITAWFTIGIPAFVLSLAPNHNRAQTGFVRRVLSRAVPAGAVIAIAAYSTYLLLRSELISPQNDAPSSVQISTATLIVVIGIAMWVLAIVAHMNKPWKFALVLAGVGAYVVLFSVPVFANFFQLDINHNSSLLVALAATVSGIVVLELLWRFGPLLWNRWLPEDEQPLPPITTAPAMD